MTKPLRLPQLDERLGAIFDSIDPCQVVADIGADHGKLSLHLLQSKRCGNALVTDISDKALSRAKRLIARHDLTGKAQFFQSDGLSFLDNLDLPPDVAVISGMGGGTVADILLKAKALPKRVLISPQTEAERVRRALVERGYAVAGEQVVRANGRFYLVIDARLQAAPVPSEAALFVGIALFARPESLVRDYLAWRLKVLSVSQDDRAPQWRQWLKEAMNSDNVDPPAGL